MVKWYHIASILGLVLFIGFIWSAERSSIDGALKFFVPILVLSVIGIAIAFLIRFVRSNKYERFDDDSSKRGFTRLPIINVSQAKFVVAKYMKFHHGINLFSFGDGPANARYTVNLIAGQCYPSGEQAWHVRFKVYDKRHFKGLMTRVIIYLNGEGRVTGEHLMNTDSYVDLNIWRNPELYFVRGPPKTPKSRSLKDIITRHVADTGELPADLNLAQIEEFDMKS